MKKFFSLCTGLIAAFTISSSVVLSVMPTAYASNDTNTIDDNGIPIVYINIDENAEGYATIQEMNESPDHSVRCTGTIKIDVPDGYTGDYSDTVLDDTEELDLEYIRGRGNLTWQADKKPYKFKLDKKAELLGMPKNKHWALIANRFDCSMLRNKIISYISERLGFEYTPKMMPVDLVINGEYAGSYYLSETVRIDKTRLNIDELKSEDNSVPEITGGYLMALDPFFFKKEINWDNVFFTNRGMKIWFEDPEFYNLDGDEVGTPEQMEYIKDYLRQAENAVMSENFTDSNGNPYTDYMDIKSAADFWWVQEFTINEDAFCSASNYFYKKRDDKLYWGPLWDFDYSMGLLYDMTDGLYHADTPWLDRLRAYEPQYQQLLRKRWNVLNDIITDVIKEGGLIDKYAEEIRNSAEDDYKKWGNNAMLHRERYDFDKEVDLLRTWIAERQAWINENIDTELTDVYVTLTFIENGKVIDSFALPKGSMTYRFPTPTITGDTHFISWVDKNKNFYSADTPILSDTVVLPYFEGEPYPSDKDFEISEVSEGLYSSQISKISEPSEISQILEISDTSEKAAISEVTDISQISDNKFASFDTSENSVMPDTVSQGENTAYVSQNPPPYENSPYTGDTGAMPFMLTAWLSSFAAVFAAKKRKKS